jgi:hypothetical protein
MKKLKIINKRLSVINIQDFLFHIFTNITICSTNQHLSLSILAILI